MWPFRKKTPEKIDTKNFTSVLCVPGNWTDREDFIRNIVSSSSGEYIAAGGVLLSVKENLPFSFEFCERDENMSRAFRYGGKITNVSDKFLEDIERHKYVVYLSHETGNLDSAKNMALAANVILKAGGIGVKVETAGKAFEKDLWTTMVSEFKTPYLYEMFVVDSITDRDGSVFSCGMQNIGYKDTIVSGLNFQSAVDLIKTFSYYQIIDKPTIQSNQTFSVAADAPKFIITDETNYLYKGDELFGNPNGMWRLSKV